jgi:glutaminyl-tRNA synthetase
VPPAAIRDFVQRVGVARAYSVVDIAMLDHSIREVLNRTAPRRMAVLRPLRLVIENFGDGAPTSVEARNNPDDPEAGNRRVPFGRELYVERDDFMEDPPKNFYRLAPGHTVRLRYAGLVICREAVKGARGEVAELRCTWQPEAPNQKVRGTIHWVSAAHSLPAEIRLYNQLFTRPDPGSEGDFIADLNSNSLEILTGARVEPALADATPGAPVQFERQGYFCLDSEAAPGRLIFNRTVALRDSWAKAQGSRG